MSYWTTRGSYPVGFTGVKGPARCSSLRTLSPEWISVSTPYVRQQICEYMFICSRTRRGSNRAPSLENQIHSFQSLYFLFLFESKSIVLLEMNEQRLKQIWCDVGDAPDLSGFRVLGIALLT